MNYKVCKVCGRYISEFNKIDDVFCPIHSICFMIKAKQYDEIYEQKERRQRRSDIKKMRATGLSNQDIVDYYA